MPSVSGLPGSGEEAFQVYVWPEQQAVKLGESWDVNCSTSCLQPEIGGVETTLRKTLLEEQPQWKQYRLSNVSEDTVIYCYFTCSGKQVSTNTSISVYRECFSWGPPAPGRTRALSVPAHGRSQHDLTSLGSRSDKEQDPGSTHSLCWPPEPAGKLSFEACSEEGDPAKVDTNLKVLAPHLHPCSAHSLLPAQ